MGLAKKRLTKNIEKLNLLSSKEGRMFNYYAEVKGRRYPITELIYMALIKLHGWQHQVTCDRLIIIGKKGV
jgi:hypothetical protein